MVELEHEVHGTGEPVVLVHAGIVADFFQPLMAEPALRDHYRLVGYHRVGYAGSDRVAGTVSIEDQAAHCLALLRDLGIGRAHLVGHSSAPTSPSSWPWTRRPLWGRWPCWSRR
jgi:3-oxoadipate enol-lactonase